MNWFTSLYRSHWRVKLMAMAMAGGLWLYAYYEGTETLTIPDVPVQIETPANWMIVGEPAAPVTVTVDFPARYHDQVRQAEREGLFHFVYKFSPEPNARPEVTVRLPVETDMFQIPEYDIKITAWKPENITFTAAHVITRDLKVKLVVQKPPTGYEIAPNPHAWPPEVPVTGPETALNKARQILTRPVPIPLPPNTDDPISGEGHHLEQSVEVDSQSVPVTCTATVGYNFHLQLVSESRVFKSVPVNISARPDYAYVTELPRDKEIEVTIKGPKNIVDAVKPQDLFLYVDVNALLPGERGTPHSVRVRYVLASVPASAPVSVTLKPETVGVEIKERPK